MPVWTEHHGNFAGDLAGEVKVAGHEMAGQGFEVNLLDGVILLLNAAVDHRVERGLIRHGIQAGGDQDAALNLGAALVP